VELYLHSPNTSLWRSALLNTETILLYFYLINSLKKIENLWHIQNDREYPTASQMLHVYSSRSITDVEPSSETGVLQFCLAENILLLIFTLRSDSSPVLFHMQ
jgi:hypothetical protein